MAGSILIAGKGGTCRESLASTLRKARYTTVLAATPDEALEAARDAAIDLVLIDESLGGAALCRRLKEDPIAREKPAIVMSALDDAAARHAALEAGADELLRKPADETALLARVRSILRMRDTSEELRRRRTTARDLGFAEAASTFAPPGRIAFVAPQDTAQERIDGLRPLLRHRMRVADRESAFDPGPTGNGADAYVVGIGTDTALRDLRLISELRSRPLSRHAAILALCPRDDVESGAMALDLGANDLVAADADAPEFALRLRTQLRRKREADLLRQAVDEDLRLAFEDPLTGLYNRRYAETHLAKVSARSAETGRTFAVMVADLDRFKAINDTYGHSGGDAVLVETARQLRDKLRGADLVARIGGEEFLIVMPDTTLEEAGMAARRLCRIIDDTPIRLPDGREIHVTLSIGVSVGGGVRGHDPVADLMEQADKALYGAKSDGRNTVTVSPAA